MYTFVATNIEISTIHSSMFNANKIILQVLVLSMCGKPLPLILLDCNSGFSHLLTEGLINSKNP